MIRRTIDVSGFDATLTARHKQILVGREGHVFGQFPAEDVGLLMIDTRQASFSNETLVTMIETGGLVVLCGSDHLPAAYVVPVQGNCLQVQRMDQQLSLSKPRQKRLWQQIVQGKLRNQSYACTSPEHCQKLKSLAERVGSGDPENVEAQGARIYWSCWLSAGEIFRRKRDGDPPNLFLNYGYSILRACVARAICAAGLNPAFGIHHCNRSNGFCLADDLMEPLRPWVDRQARKLHARGEVELNKLTKAPLMSVLYEECQVGEQRTTLQTAVERMVDSLVRCLTDTGESLVIPRLLQAEISTGIAAVDDSEAV
jgi:CRISPR-associated protein Cas1